jgi:hypothetical protein
MGKHINRRHPESGELFTDLRARACAMRAKHTPILQIARALGVSRSCAHRWVLEAPEHGAATAQNGGVRVYPPGTRQLANKLRKAGYPREQRIAMVQVLAGTGAPETAGGIRARAACASDPVPQG